MAVKTEDILLVETIRKMTIEKLKRLNREGVDPEMSHIEADKVLCDYLRALGEHAIVDEFEKVPKWYS